MYIQGAFRVRLQFEINKIKRDRQYLNNQKYFDAIIKQIEKVKNITYNNNLY